jgi:acetyl-CoA acetyltransferase
VTVGAVPLDDIQAQVAITGIGESEHTGVSNRTTKEIAAEAVERAIADAGLTPADIDGIMYHPMGGDQFDEHDFRALFGTTHEMWVSRDGGGMRWAATAPYEAALAIRDGRAHHVLNSFAVAWATQRREMVGGPGQAHAENLLKQNLEVPMGLFPQPVYAAVMARRHMVEWGTTPDDLAAVAVTMRAHANATPAAVMHARPLTRDDYFASAVIADPLRKFDCCLISDGGGAYIVSAVDVARGLAQPVVTVDGVGLSHSPEGSFWSLRPDITTTEVAQAGPAALAMAGVAAPDLDVLAVYDPFTIVTLMVLEDLGVCGRGDAGTLARAGGLRYDGGRCPTNPHGGLHSHAYVLGIAHVVELVRQLRGTAAAQVSGARVGAYAASTGPDAGVLVLRRAGVRPQA